MKSSLYFVIDEGNSRCGITDRLKAAVGLCYLARLHGLDFRLIHRAEFDIRKYLLPNRIDWSAEPSELSDASAETVFFRYRSPYEDLPAFSENRRYVCRDYVGNNILEKWNVPSWEKAWRELFWEMFRPSELLCEAMSAYPIPDRFSAVVVRFVNSLGHAEDTPYNAPFSPEMQSALIEAALAKVAECERASDAPAIVYSDSARFLEAAAAAGHQITDVKGIGNIMNRNLGDYVALRTFLNLFQMAKAETIYSVLHLDGFPENSLYKTQYPRYAAIIGDRPFVRL